MAKQLQSPEFDLLSQQIASQTTLINAQFINVDLQFKGINERLDKLNGKVARHDQSISDALEERSGNRMEQQMNFKLGVEGTQLISDKKWAVDSISIYIP